MKRSLDINQVQNLPMNNNNNDTIDDIEDEEEINNNIPNAGLMNGEDVNLVQASKDYIDAVRSIANNPWDHISWFMYLEEVEEGRGGSATLEEAFTKFLERFPLAFKIWKQLGVLYQSKQDFRQAEATYHRCLDACRNVQLWLDYLNMLRITMLDKVNRQDEKQYNLARQTFENALERAVVNVGMAPDSYPLWRAYIDFVKEFPELNTADPARRVQSLRKVYQRAICVPLHDLDTLWREYETLERSAGELLAERVLPEFRDRNVHAKAIFKERERLTSMLALDRLALPPSNQSSGNFEAQQLDTWNKWIRYEMTNPDNLSRESLRAMLHFAYSRCLCCFRFHPEVWLSFAQLEFNEFGSANESRIILLQAVEAMPEVAVLRIALAEYDERLGGEAVHGSAAQGLSSARGILKTAFDNLPSAYTFSVYQRFIRRCDGKQAARRVFTDTFRLRQERRLGLDIFLAHAQLELEVNSECQVAAQVMKLALNTFVDALASESFVRLYVQILVRLGDLRQIQWVCQSALGREVAPAPSSEGNMNLIVSNLEHTIRTEGTLLPAPIQRPIERYSILNDLLEAETLLCQSDISRLDDLRKRRNVAKAAVDEINRGIDLSTGKDTQVAGLFDAARDIYERYGISSTLTEGPDVQLRERVRIRFSESAMLSGDPGAGFSAEPRQKKLSAISLGRDRETSAATSGPVESPLVRELLFKLPPYNDPSPDVDSFIRHLRGTILPPRPGADGELATSNRREDDGMMMDVVRPGGGDDNMGDDAVAAPIREDVFRERRRGGTTKNINTSFAK